MDEADGDMPARKRGSSLSITYSDVDVTGAQPWSLTLEWQDSGDSDETVLSVQVRYY